jgi:hypothetical protein
MLPAMTDVPVYTLVTAVVGGQRMQFISMQPSQSCCIAYQPCTADQVEKANDSCIVMGACCHAAAALVAPGSVSSPLKPLPTSRPTYWWWNEVARLATSGEC